MREVFASSPRLPLFHEKLFFSGKQQRPDGRKWRRRRDTSSHWLTYTMRWGGRANGMGIDKHLKKKNLKHNVGVCISERQEGKLRPKCGKIPVQHWRILVPLSAYPFCQRRRRRRRRRWPSIRPSFHFGSWFSPSLPLLYRMHFPPLLRISSSLSQRMRNDNTAVAHLLMPNSYSEEGWGLFLFGGLLFAICCNGRKRRRRRMETNFVPLPKSTK